MIRTILPDLIALVIFPLGGALYGLIVLSLLSHSIKGIKGYILEFLIGLLGGIIFLALTEVYYNTIVTSYTATCYAIGFIGVLLFFSKRNPKPKGNKKKVLQPLLIKIKNVLKRKFPSKNRQNKTPKLKAKTPGNS